MSEAAKGVEHRLNGPTLSAVRSHLDGIEPIDRPSMGAFDDPVFGEAVEAPGPRLSPVRTAVVRPWRNIDVGGGASSLLQMVALLDRGVHLAVDLSEVAFVDAAGLSALVGSVRRVRALGGTAELRSPRPGVRRRMELVGMDRLMVPSPFRSVGGAVGQDQDLSAAG